MVSVVQEHIKILCLVERGNLVVKSCVCKCVNNLLASFTYVVGRNKSVNGCALLLASLLVESDEHDFRLVVLITLAVVVLRISSAL